MAGLSGGDVLIALDGLRIHDLDAMLARYQAVKVTAFSVHRLPLFEWLLQRERHPCKRVWVRPLRRWRLSQSR